jgi:hypothetical protein
LLSEVLTDCHGVTRVCSAYLCGRQWLPVGLHHWTRLVTNQLLQLSFNDHYLGGPPRANNVYSSVSRVVISCTPGHVKLMSFHRPVVLHALSSSRGLQSLDCDLGADCKYYADNKDVCSDE